MGFKIFKFPVSNQYNISSLIVIILMSLSPRSHQAKVYSIQVSNISCINCANAIKTALS